MLEFLRGKGSERKLRLFAVACCHRVWRWLPDEGSRNAVIVAEWYADGLANEEEMDAAAAAASEPAARGADHGWAGDPSVQAATAAFTVVSTVSSHLAAMEVAKLTAEGAVKCDLLRDIFGPTSFRSSSVANFASTAIAVAQSLYTERAFEQLSTLADALEEAGCADRAILDHCRQPGVHVRGCWVTDLILGKS